MSSSGRTVGYPHRLHRFQRLFSPRESLPGSARGQRQRSGLNRIEHLIHFNILHHTRLPGFKPHVPHNECRCSPGFVAVKTDDLLVCNQAGCIIQATVVPQWQTYAATIIPAVSSAISTGNAAIAPPDPAQRSNRRNHIRKYTIQANTAGSTCCFLASAIAAIIFLVLASRAMGVCQFTTPEATLINGMDRICFSDALYLRSKSRQAT